MRSGLAQMKGIPRAASAAQPLIVILGRLDIVVEEAGAEHIGGLVEPVDAASALRPAFAAATLEQAQIALAARCDAPAARCARRSATTVTSPEVTISSKASGETPRFENLPADRRARPGRVGQQHHGPAARGETRPGRRRRAGTTRGHCAARPRRRTARRHSGPRARRGRRSRGRFGGRVFAMGAS